jgi:hypothetical protein
MRLPFPRPTPKPRDGLPRACSFSFADRATIANAVDRFKPVAAPWLALGKADLT